MSYATFLFNLGTMEFLGQGMNASMNDAHNLGVFSLPVIIIEAKGLSQLGKLPKFFVAGQICPFYQQ